MGRSRNQLITKQNGQFLLKTGGGYNIWVYYIVSIRDMGRKIAHCKDSFPLLVFCFQPSKQKRPRNDDSFLSDMAPVQKKIGSKREKSKYEFPLCIIL